MMRFLKAIAILGAGAAGIAGAAVGAQAQQGGSGADQVCAVTVQRDQAAGVLDVTRQVFDDGSCNCFVYTGHESQATGVESRVSSIVRSRRCPNARPMKVGGADAGLTRSPMMFDPLGAGFGADRDNLLPVVLGFGAVAAATIIIIEDNDRSSP